MEIIKESMYVGEPVSIQAQQNGCDCNCNCSGGQPGKSGGQNCNCYCS